jgi:hypothetical protein
MEGSIIIRAVLMWALFLPVPICNGLLREYWYKRRLGEQKAHWIGSIIVSSFFVIYTYIFLGGYVISLSMMTLIGIGSLWVVMTFVFESALGVKNGMTWREIFADYDVRNGRVWGLVLLTIFLAPVIVRFIVIMIK